MWAVWVGGGGEEEGGRGGRRQIVSLITNKDNSTYISNDKSRPFDRQMTSNGEDNLRDGYKLNGNRGIQINKSRVDSLCTDQSCL